MNTNDDMGKRLDTNTSAYANANAHDHNDDAAMFANVRN